MSLSVTKRGRKEVIKEALAQSRAETES